MTVWHSPQTADRYDRYTQKFPLYATTSARLVAAAGIRPGSRVLDLGCGTGVTTRALLARVGPAGQVLAVDSSPAMLDTARANVRADNVSWYQGDARDVDRLVGGKVDAAVSNMAFWQFDLVPTLAAVAKVLTDEGSLTFSIGYRVRPDAAAIASHWRRTLRDNGYDLVEARRSEHRESALSLREWSRLALVAQAAAQTDDQPWTLHTLYFRCRPQG
ncbi:class I SAM-dependent DNA methyltransferase [Kutzneria kofuensis]|uniref:Ubiquinone/menaquinone biosynthesis C-methylase UbiE n=1 Tax=Kutzneria kofuensis TaxID=103725 RepID=A0A7W9KP73_9PSEU|nr:class I SAM-dependent methyltransferase [Kutzneria kofuensis]MBB5896082.1 ubiquinone/menaquinone biosynthesis C-methylase UbiE [Kutzneria kofuensis]